MFLPSGRCSWTSTLRQQQQQQHASAVPCVRVVSIAVAYTESTLSKFRRKRDVIASRNTILFGGASLRSLSAAVPFLLSPPAQSKHSSSFDGYRRAMGLLSPGLPARAEWQRTAYREYPNQRIPLPINCRMNGMRTTKRLRQAMPTEYGPVHSRRCRVLQHFGDCDCDCGGAGHTLHREFASSAVVGRHEQCPLGLKENKPSANIPERAGSDGGTVRGSRHFKLRVFVVSPDEPTPREEWRRTVAVWAKLIS